MATTTVNVHHQGDEEVAVSAELNTTTVPEHPYVVLRVGGVDFFVSDPELLAEIAFKAAQHVEALVVANRAAYEAELAADLARDAVSA